MEDQRRKQDALDFHSMDRPGKIEVVPTKPLTTQRDLALAYSPGVAEPCKEIYKDVENVYKYTAKGNLVAVISNGTAVLGLGNIGPEAGKPVMEGKGVLFKKFAGIDVFDIELRMDDVQGFIQVVKALEPTFGGINLEDIKAPESFEIEQQLRAELKIPVMHDDQHGTAIISGAALLNALEVANKKIGQVKLVISGAGAAAISCANIYISLGMKKSNIVMFDSKGVLCKKRKDLNKYKEKFAIDDFISLEQAMKGADVFIGLSTKDLISPKMLLSMAKTPIVFAMANPDPEIKYELAVKTRNDIIMATGRSDYPNQVNNVLGFPYIFRGALDVRATQINEAMKLAAVKALAQLAKESVPDSVINAYGGKKFSFGKEYLIPTPLDPRLITVVAPAVAKAAMDSGVAKIKIKDWKVYETELLKRMGIDQKLMSNVINRAKMNKKRVVFAEADNLKILKAAQIIKDEEIAIPILLGNIQKIKQLIKDNKLGLKDTQIIDPHFEAENKKDYIELFYKKRQRKGVTLHDAKTHMKERNYFGAMMVEKGDADALISGLTKNYRRTILPALEVIGVEKGIRKVAGMYILITKKGTFFLADTTVNVNPSVEDLVDIAGLTARAVKYFNVEPHIAMLSYTNFGSSNEELPEKVKEATRLAKLRYPELVIDGEIQANFAVNPQLLKDNYPFCDLASHKTNTLIFPDLASGNMAYKLLQELGDAEAIGPILMGMAKPVHILQLGSSVREIVNMVAIAAIDAQLVMK
ncbi:MAG: malic enzyme [Bacteroidetes bacterium RIFCSPLOWO2_12_FULL_37_12]|nr:MAG: malic enzyme [Bacteroidetes bacterium RIFCSPLOWO2_12_FULL_37_12]